MLDVYIKLPKPKFKEGSGFVAVSYFRNSATGEAPTTARYRIDCLTTGREVLGWTTLTPATSINISITGTDNAIIDASSITERKQITVEADAGLSTQSRNTAYYEVENIRGI